MLKQGPEAAAVLTSSSVGDDFNAEAGKSFVPIPCCSTPSEQQTRDISVGHKSALNCQHAAYESNVHCIELQLLLAGATAFRSASFTSDSTTDKPTYHTGVLFQLHRDHAS